MLDDETGDEKPLLDRFREHVNQFAILFRLQGHTQNISNEGHTYVERLSPYYPKNTIRHSLVAITLLDVQILE